MMLPAPPQTNPGIEIVLANANFADPATATRHRLWTPAAIGEFAQEAGYNGVEWSPVWPLVGTQRRITRAVASGSLVLSSLHAGFADRHPLEAPEPNYSLQAKVLGSVAGRLAVVSVQQSCSWMRALQAKLATGCTTAECSALDEVHYPVFYGAGYDTDANSARTLWQNDDCNHRLMLQPTDWIAKALGVHDIVSMSARLKRRGFDMDYPFVMDTHHMRRSEKGVPRVVSSIDKSLGDLAQRTGEIHLSLARLDMMQGMKAEDTMCEARCAVSESGRFTGQLKDILTAALERGGVRRIVVEAPAQYLELLLESTSRPTLLGAYAIIAAKTRGFANQVRAQTNSRIV